MINYSVGKSREDKTPDKDDLALIERINKMEIPYWYPTNLLPKGDKTGDATKVGVTHVHQFYTKRNLTILAAMFAKTKSLLESFGLLLVCKELQNVQIHACPKRWESCG